MIRVQLELQSVSVVTDNVSRQQTTFHDEVNRKLQQNLASHVHIQQRLDTMQQIMTDNFLRLQTNINAEIGPNFVPVSAQRDNTTRMANKVPHIRGIAIRASHHTGIFCNNLCPCACHRRQELRTPDFVRPILGHLFIGYSGLPGLQSPCDNGRCKRMRSTAIMVEYWFPLWLLAQIVQLVFALHPVSGPQLQLRTLRRIPDSAQCISFALNGNIEGIKSLFSRGLASVNDISQSRDFTILRVSSSTPLPKSLLAHISLVGSICQTARNLQIPFASRCRPRTGVRPHIWPIHRN